MNHTSAANARAKVKMHVAVTEGHRKPHGGGNEHHVEGQQAGLFDISGKLDQFFNSFPQAPNQAGKGSRCKFANTIQQVPSRCIGCCRGRDCLMRITKPEGIEYYASGRVFAMAASIGRYAKITNINA